MQEKWLVGKYGLVYLEKEEGFCSQKLVISLISLSGLIVELNLPEKE